MQELPKNIKEYYEKFNVRESKESFLNQNAKAIWLTGLSGAGKTTLSIALEQELFKRGFLCHIIDGDNVRNKLNKDLGFTDNDRSENIRRIAEVSSMFINAGIITINAFVSPTTKIRNIAKNIIGENDFLEVFINSSLETCEKRDIKGLYKKARIGEIKEFTGISSPYEKPINPFTEIKTDDLSIEQSINLLLDKIIPVITKI